MNPFAQVSQVSAQERLQPDAIEPHQPRERIEISQDLSQAQAPFQC
jgi:hypothetical protein